MIALDTNVLVRLLTRDDHRQAEKVRVLFESHADKDDEFFVSDVVLAELAWTLERAYDFDRAEIGKTFRALVGNATLGFESRNTLRLAQAIFDSSKAGFADCLIVAKAQALGCTSLVTFDKALRPLPNVELL
jgi:predicted nucleic-acid-binding protein